MSTEIIYKAVLKAASQTGKKFGRHLDIGSGSGKLISLFREKFGTEASACDYTTELMKLSGQTVDVANLNHQPLPYPDGTFDIVTATEVIEHLEHYRETLREIHRILKPGGVCILTTPNVLNLNSRLRYLWFGFYNLFGPLPIKHSSLYSTGGHINPVSYFYVAHSLYDADFSDVKVTADKYQKSSFLKLALLWLPIRLLGALALRKEIRRFHTITDENGPIVREMNSIPVLLGRTIVVTAVKK